MKRIKNTQHKIDTGGNNPNDYIALSNNTEKGVPQLKI